MFCENREDGSKMNKISILPHRIDKFSFQYMSYFTDNPTESEINMAKEQERTSQQIVEDILETIISNTVVPDT